MFIEAKESFMISCLALVLFSLHIIKVSLPSVSHLCHYQGENLCLPTLAFPYCSFSWEDIKDICHLIFFCPVCHSSAIVCFHLWHYPYLQHFLIHVELNFLFLVSVSVIQPVFYHQSLYFNFAILLTFISYPPRVPPPPPQTRSSREELQTWCWGPNPEHYHGSKRSHEDPWEEQTRDLWAHSGSLQRRQGDPCNPNEADQTERAWWHL